MRALVVVLALILTTVPALAQQWQSYENARFGFVIAVPPGFTGGGEADNGDGQIFRSGDGTQLLRVYGGNNLEASFAASLKAGIGFARDAGWDLSYERVTRTWASYSGTRGSKILYARAIALCDGTQFAAYELEYPRIEDRSTMDTVIKRLNASLEATGDGVSC